LHELQLIVTNYRPVIVWWPLDFGYTGNFIKCTLTNLHIRWCSEEIKHGMFFELTLANI